MKQGCDGGPHVSEIPNHGKQRNNRKISSEVFIGNLSYVMSRSLEVEIILAPAYVALEES